MDDDAGGLPLIPEEFAFLWKVTDCHERLCATLRKLEADCGDGEIGQATKRQLAEQRVQLRNLIYSLLYGGEPPFDLPDNWEDKS
jgi:hypothetical protein